MLVFGSLVQNVVDITQIKPKTMRILGQEAEKETEGSIQNTCRNDVARTISMES
jgi:hypothetical protein